MVDIDPLINSQKLTTISERAFIHLFGRVYLVSRGNRLLARKAEDLLGKIETSDAQTIC